MWKTIIFLGIAYLIVKYLFLDKKENNNKFKNNIKKNKANKIQHYKEKGLDDKDIDIFRDTMKEARDNIKFWNSQLPKYEKLDIIEEQTAGLESSKKIFQAIVEEPAEMTKENDFLYKDLPNMVTLVKKYGELTDVRPETQEVKMELAERLYYITKLSEKITKNYQAMLIDDVDEIKHALKEKEIEEKVEEYE
ncbi:5-bromo-4-chloroindolyl phosphate hydrolysis family protein [Floricoccus penangensis]|uniref:5-bromo-4-chloroindolyl phosphate hydrolysis protein n=1 Tax=Floricoccus penangensis TaxID=1859475 RepID=A0A9Q5JFK2_9LACT|nr:5-bromo-4-chloroindolyl phosphate hydrolysis family protein [Floricoccus penangensis]OFI46408.1 hypothetical protein BG262_05170 [Floricoccus penangensis]URZ87143.1 5-bromo-4-chloroindolyl phosphate hydrolysis family protein [Floricoccus penangensis]